MEGAFPPVEMFWGNQRRHVTTEGTPTFIHIALTQDALKYLAR
jgi:hypothetical protein